MFDPDTEKLCGADAKPEHFVNALSVPVTTIVGVRTTIEVVAVQPKEFLYVIVAVPALTPVTKPAGDTVAIELFEEVHGLVALGVSLPDKLIVRPTLTVLKPVIVAASLRVPLTATTALSTPAELIVMLPELVPFAELL
jgi:hypothetical protein